MIGYSKKNRKIIRESVFDKKEKKPGLKFDPGLGQLGPGFLEGGICHFFYTLDRA